MQTFFYDQQIRRFLLQFIRIISNFQVEFGKDANGVNALLRVPVFYGDASRQASQIIKGNSENTMSNVPAIAVYIAGLTYDRDRVQEPSFVSKMKLRERAVDSNTGDILNVQGGTYTVDRPMPVPYRLQLKADIWTSNTEQKLQLIEQLAILFNPAMEIQSTSNYIDWSSLSAIFLTDISWTSRSVPTGTEEPIDIATMTFELPIWLSAPVLIKQLGVVTNMATSIFNQSGELNSDAVSDLPLLSDKKSITPFGGEISIVYTRNTLELVSSSGRKSWRSLIEMYGNLINGISQVRLQRPYVPGAEIVGYISYHPTDDSLLLFNVDQDTLPTNTLDPVTAIIDPYKLTRADPLIIGATAGTRYLVLNRIGDWSNVEAAVAWPARPGSMLVANANDIIEFDGEYWSVSFDSKNKPNVEHVTNLNTSIQYRWDGEHWLHSFEGEYTEGTWSLVL